MLEHGRIQAAEHRTVISKMTRTDNF